MSVAYFPTKDAARERNALGLEIRAIERAAMKSEGRLALDWRAKRLRGMLHNLYHASITGDNLSATEIRLRTLLLRFAIALALMKSAVVISST